MRAKANDARVPGCKNRAAWPDLGFMGDDIIDLPALRMVGLAIAPANARPWSKRAHAVTDAPGATAPCAWPSNSS